jgi:localization factor PodJL
MSLGHWLNSTLGNPAPAAAPTAQPQHQQQHYAPPPRQPMPGPETDSISEIHRRLDGITRQIDQMSQRRPGAPVAPPAAPASPASSLASQLNDAISRLDMRLSSLTQTPPQARQQNPAYGHAAAPRGPAQPSQNSAYHTAPPLSPAGLDAAIAEITARQNSLIQGHHQGNNGQGYGYAAAPNPFMPQAPAQPPAPQPVPVDLSGIERQLNHLTSQMEALRRPDHLDESITAFREELAEIRRSLTEALPRQAIDSLEGEIRALGQKIERSRDTVGDQDALGSIEKALNDIYSAVRTLTPAEQLAGYDNAIQNLSGKIDLLVRANPDSNIVQQLEDAIGALRNIVANIASNEAIGHLSDHIRTLGEKVDHLAQSGGHDMLAALEQRIALLTAAMEGRPVAPASDFSHLESAIRTLTDRIDRISVGGDSSGAMAHVEQRIAYLLERLEGTQPFNGNLGRIEEGLSDILRQLEGQRANFASVSGGGNQDALGLVDTIKRELSDVRHTQSATEQRTQDTLEAVHGTLTHVVDRLTTIEGDLRRAQPSFATQPAPLAQPAPFAHDSARPAFATSFAATPAVRPDLPNPVLQPAGELHLPLAAAPSIAPAFGSGFGANPAPMLGSAPAAPASAFRSDEIAPSWQQSSAQRPPIDPNLPPDFPLEPGARGLGASGLEADDIGGDAAPAVEGNSQSNFIAAARRAAQAAAAANVEKPSRVAALTEAARNAAAKATSKVTSAAASDGSTAKPSRIRQILVGFGVVMIVIGAFKVALTLLDGADTTPSQQMIEKSAAPTAIVPAPVAPAPSPKAEVPPPASPLLTSPTAVERHSFVAPVVNSTPAPSPITETPAAARTNDVTGSVTAPATATSAPMAYAAPAAVETAAPVAALPTANDAIPDTLAGPMLRAAALRGEPAAAYEIASRYSEGKGAQVNYEEALKWYARAADKGIVMAMFRLGTMMEKGLGTKKDPESARHYYIQAAERGNAKAMHNLAVLDADGGGKGPNYKSASTWFRKAADRGIADSQYNLGILYARGIGVEQNLAESFKWFSLAAAQGDADSGRKRDDVSKRLDQQSLAAAKLAIQTFTPERQPEEAIAVAAPVGGWDASTAAKPTGKGGAAKAAPAKSAPKQHTAAR